MVNFRYGSILRKAIAQILFLSMNLFITCDLRMFRMRDFTQLSMEVMNEKTVKILHTNLPGRKSVWVLYSKA